MNEPVTTTSSAASAARSACAARRSVRLARWLDTNLGGSGLLREELRHIFPDSWAFFLGEIALYCFIILVATGIFLALFFQASEAPVVYDGLVRAARRRRDVRRLRLGAAT